MNKASTMMGVCLLALGSFASFAIADETYVCAPVNAGLATGEIRILKSDAGLEVFMKNEENQEESFRVKSSEHLKRRKALKGFQCFNLVPVEQGAERQVFDEVLFPREILFESGDTATVLLRGKNSSHQVMTEGFHCQKQ